MSTAACFVIVRVSPTIANEYASRCPEGIPEEVYLTGRRSVRLESARAMLADAEYQTDPAANDCGEYGVPLPAWNAYKALARQLRAVLGSTR
jgi:hypothetical protein